MTMVFFSFLFHPWRRKHSPYPSPLPTPKPTYPFPTYDSFCLTRPPPNLPPSWNFSPPGEEVAFMSYPIYFFAPAWNAHLLRNLWKWRRGLYLPATLMLSRNASTGLALAEIYRQIGRSQLENKVVRGWRLSPVWTQAHNGHPIDVAVATRLPPWLYALSIDLTWHSNHTPATREHACKIVQDKRVWNTYLHVALGGLNNLWRRV